MMSITLLCQHRCSTRMLCVLSSVSVSVCGLGTSTKSHKIHEFGWNTTKKITKSLLTDTGIVVGYFSINWTVLFIESCGPFI